MQHIKTLDLEIGFVITASMDSFRNPKLAASVYASQQDEEPILAISTSMDIGDYNAGNLPDFYAFTNADEVRLYKMISLYLHFLILHILV